MGWVGGCVWGGGEDAQVVGTLCRLSVNSHTVTDAELRPVGAGIYPLAALANHSCDPNCAQEWRAASSTPSSPPDLYFISRPPPPCNAVEWWQWEGGGM